MALGTDNFGQPEAQAAEAPAEQPAPAAREVIASPSRRADGSVTHAADAEIPDPDGYADSAAAQIANLADVDAEKAYELGRAEATRGGQTIETTEAAPEVEQH